MSRLDKKRTTCHSFLEWEDTATVYRVTPAVEERKKVQRATLLEAAVRLFGRHGYHATTVPMIVKAASSSTGAFYMYFRNKEDVFAAALERFGERINIALNQAIDAAPPSVSQRMSAACEELVRFMADNPDEARIWVIETSGLSKRLNEIRRAIMDSHARAVHVAVAALRPDLDAEVMARCWIGAVHEVVHYWLALPASKRPPAEVVGRSVAEFNLRGIGAPTGA